MRVGPLAALTALLACACAGDAQAAAREAFQRSSVAGHVRNADGRPVSRARVVLRPTRAQAVRQTLTDTHGRFRIEDVAPGTYQLSAYHNQYLPAHYGARMSGQPGRPLTIRPGDGIAATLVLSRGAAITGRIFDETGEPMSDVTVQAYRVRRTGSRVTLEPAGGRAFASNDIGQYRLSNLPAGAVLIAATIRGEADSRNDGGPREGYGWTWYPGSVSMDNAQPVNLAVGRESHGIDFVLHSTRLSSVSGTIRRSDGTPARRAVMSVSSPRGHALSPRVAIQMEASGTFRVTDLPPGDYVLGVIDSADTEAVEYGHAPLSVGGESHDGFELRLRPGVPVSIRVQTNIALPRNLVAHLSGVEPPAATRSAELVAGHGRVSLPPGRYRVSLSGLPDAVVDYLTDGERRLAGDLLPVGEMALPRLTLHVIAAASLAGVLQAGSTLAAPFSVVALAEDPAHHAFDDQGVRVVESDALGGFSIDGLRPGTYRVAALDSVTAEDVLNVETRRQIENAGTRVVLLPGQRAHVSAPVTSGR